MIESKKLLFIALFISSASFVVGEKKSTDGDDLLDNQDVLEVIGTSQFSNCLSRATASKEVADLLIDANAINILQQDLYLRTHPLNDRNLIYLPIFFIPHVPFYNLNLSAHVFWNQTRRAYFSPHSSAICSYLAINSPDLLSEISRKTDENGQPLAESILNNFNIDPLVVFPLFTNMTIEDRRIGAMFYVERQFGTVLLEYMLPFYYRERNFFLTDEEQEAIERALGQTSRDEQFAFAKKHLISDKIGFGDSRFTLDFLAHEGPHYFFRFGIQSTIPTAFAFVKGVMGTEFRKCYDRPTIDIGELIDLGKGTTQQREQAAKIGETFLLGSLDALAADLLETGLGYNKHFGLGIYSRSGTELERFVNRPWAQNFSIRSRISIEYLFPHDEIRYFVVKSDQAAYDALGLNRSITDIKTDINNDPAYADSVVTFLEGQLADKLYPFPFRTRVHPGLIFQSITSFYYEGERFCAYLGTDTFVELKEKLPNVCIRKTSDGRPANIDIHKATRPLAYQGKLQGAIMYKAKRAAHDWIISLHADDTLLSSGIGKDFSISLNFGANF